MSRLSVRSRVGKSRVARFRLVVFLSSGSIWRESITSSVKMAVLANGVAGVMLVLAVSGCAPVQAKPRSEARYITMRDGTRIAIDIWRPLDVVAERKLPTVMKMTRYWRGFEQTNYNPQFDGEAQEAAIYNNAGYVLVTVDARGTGASFGVSTAPWSPDELANYREVVDWIIAQDWSNGRVGAIGIGYDGNTALLLGAMEHPAVKAVVPRFYDLDPYRTPGRPGGILAEGFVASWSAQNEAMDNNDIGKFGEAPGLTCEQIKEYFVGTKPGDADTNRSLLRAAVAVCSVWTVPLLSPS